MKRGSWPASARTCPTTRSTGWPASSRRWRTSRIRRPPSSAPPDAARIHLADSLVALDLPEVAAAERIADIGAGAGFPGLALAVTLPSARVDLVESTRRKCEVIERLAAAAEAAQRHRGPRAGRGLGARRRAGRPTTSSRPGRWRRSRCWRSTRRRCSRQGGALVAWKGRRDDVEERGGRDRGAAARTGARPCASRRPLPGRARPPPPHPAQDRPDARSIPAETGPGPKAPACLTLQSRFRQLEKDLTVRGRTMLPGASFRPLAPLPCETDGHHLRDHQPEGRRRQDDHRRQRRGQRRRRGVRDPARRPRPAVQRHGGGGPGQGPQPLGVRLPQR